MHNPELEVKIAQTATLEEFKEFLQRTFLCYEAQIALVKRQDQALLKEYVSRFVLCEEAQIALAELRNKEILIIYAEKYKLCLEATKALILQLR